MRDASWSLVPTAKCGLSKVGACQNNTLSGPPPPALVGLYSAVCAACAKPAWLSNVLARGAVRPRPTILRTKARRDTRPAFTAAISFRKSCSFMEYPRPSLSRHDGLQQTKEQFSSVYYRWQIRPRGLVVEPDRHQGQLMDQAHFVLQAPAEQLAVARRHQNPAAVEARCCPDQRLEAVVGLGDGMRKEGYVAAIGSDFTEML